MIINTKITAIIAYPIFVDAKNIKINMKANIPNTDIKKFMPYSYFLYTEKVI